MKLNRQSFSITTPRLILVPISLDHKEEMSKEFTDEITALMYLSTQKTLDETISYIEASIHGFVEQQEIVVAILHRESREYLGNAGLHHIDSVTPELSIWVKKTAHGNGYGREAVEGLKTWADKYLVYTYLRYPVYSENIAGRSIPESLGGILKREYESGNQKGEMHHTLDYYIYKGER